MQLSTETKVNHLKSAAVFQVRFPIVSVAQEADFQKMYRNAKRRTKTKQAAKEIVSFKFISAINQWVAETDMMQWISEHASKLRIYKADGCLHDFVVVCHDADTAMQFKLRFC